MIPLQPQGLRRADYLESFGTLAVVRPQAPGAPLDAAAADDLEPFILVRASGEVTAFNGHVDLGTGVRTALAQIVAEELDVPLARVSMVLGDTRLAPDQGPTIASETIQLSAIPLRHAAAQARRFLVDRAAATFGVTAEALIVEDGVVRPPADDNRRLSYGELIGEERIRLKLSDDAPVKAPAAYRIVGASPPRVDLPAKATGGLVYVHDMRTPGMLHGRVVRPPYAGFDLGDHVGRSLIRVDEATIAGLPGIVATVVMGDFVGVVAEREEQAEAAMRALKSSGAKARSRRTSPTSPARSCATRHGRASCSTRATSIALSSRPPDASRAPTSGLTSCTARSARPQRSPTSATARRASGPARRTPYGCGVTSRCFSTFPKTPSR